MAGLIGSKRRSWAFLTAGLCAISAGGLVRAEVLTRQVLIEVKVAEVSRTLSRELGIDNRIADVLSKLPADAAKLPSPEDGILGLGPSPSAETVRQRLFPPDQIPGSINLSGLITDQQFKAILHVLDREKGAKIFEQPAILAPSEQETNFYLDPSVVFPQGNLILTTTPTLAPNGDILIKIDPKIRSENGSVFPQPLKTVEGNETSTVPALGQIPVLSGLFSPRNKPKQNLILFITSRPVDVLSGTGGRPEKIKTEITGTGDTIEHIADFNFQNLTNEPLKFLVPPFILESANGKTQDYASPRQQEVSLGPQETLSIPVTGVCLERGKPPAGDHVAGELFINTGDSTIPKYPEARFSPKQARDLLQITDSKYRAAETLVKDREFKGFPYPNKKKQIEIAVQWSVWSDPKISEITGDPPAKKDDLKQVVYRQKEEKGKMKSQTKKKIDNGIDTIWDKIELTSAKAKELEKPDPFASVELTGEKAKAEQSPPEESPSPTPSP